MAHSQAYGTSPDEERRQAERLPIRFVAHVAHGADAALPVRVLNISRSGFMAECGGAPKPGAVVTFAAPNAETFPATVQWARDGRIGCRFATELSWEDLLGLGLDELDSDDPATPADAGAPGRWQLIRRALRPSAG